MQQKQFALSTIVFTTRRHYLLLMAFLIIEEHFNYFAVMLFII